MSVLTKQMLGSRWTRRGLYITISASETGFSFAPYWQSVSLTLCRCEKRRQRAEEDKSNPSHVSVHWVRHTMISMTGSPLMSPSLSPFTRFRCLSPARRPSPRSLTRSLTVVKRGRGFERASTLGRRRHPWPRIFEPNIVPAIHRPRQAFSDDVASHVAPSPFVGQLGRSGKGHPPIAASHRWGPTGK